MRKLSHMGVVGCVLWLVLVAAGTVGLSRYQSIPGKTAPTPAVVTPELPIQLDADYPTLFMFAHPRCPCTRASIGELNRLLAQTGGHVATHIYFFKPAGQPGDWTRTDLWNSAKAIPGVLVHEDIDGRMAASFGAETSGFVVLYDPHGKLLFKGGITGGRGHAGDNSGLSTAVSLLNGQATEFSQTPVYGCSILDKCEVPERAVAR